MKQKTIIFEPTRKPLNDQCLNLLPECLVLALHMPELNLILDCFQASLYSVQQPTRHGAVNP